MNGKWEQRLWVGRLWVFVAGFVAAGVIWLVYH